jgi:hypothetical protein
MNKIVYNIVCLVHYSWWLAVDLCLLPGTSIHQNEK